jgi:penicillin V acylase-like amidase (Ntn superfamily)
MKRKIVGIIFLMLLIGTISLQVTACTGFTASDNENVLVGCNFDWSQNFNVYMHFFPAEEEKFGRVIFDMWYPTEDNTNYILPKQGMNDQGLYYDIVLSPILHPVNSKDKPIFYSDDPDYYASSYWAYCLAKCSTVSEVLEVFDQYNLEVMYFFQLFFVDRFGDSVIIEGDDIIYREGDFQVVSSFLQSHPELGGIGTAFERYYTAVSMLENMSEFSVDYFTLICDSTDLDITVFSNIYDITKGKMYIYYYMNYETVLEIDFNQELSKGKSRIHLGSLFEPEDNQPPDKPEPPTGETSGLPGDKIDYSASKTTDPNDDLIMYLFDWGDGSDSGWIMPSIFGSIKATHNWTEKGNYEVKVKARDMFGSDSEWSDPLLVSMSKNKFFIMYQFILWRFIEKYPILGHLLTKGFID